MNRFLKVSIVVVLLGVAAYFSYKFIDSWQTKRLERAKIEERKAWQEKTKTLTEKIANLQEEITKLKGQVLPKDKLSEVLGKEATEAGGQPEKPIGLEELQLQVSAFFSYLDAQEYVAAYHLKGGTRHQFDLAVRKLSLNPPILSGETSSLYSLFRNMAHFYRVLGKSRVYLIKDVLKNESDILEPVMKTFYLWFTTPGKPPQKIKGRPSPKVLYEYAGYFLNTLAGRSYLLRRDSKMRILTSYYCVLLLDRANDEGLNANGIDIRPYIKYSINDISSQIGLIYQKQYLSKLADLSKKYQL